MGRGVLSVRGLRVPRLHDHLCPASKRSSGSAVPRACVCVYISAAASRERIRVEAEWAAALEALGSAVAEATATAEGLAAVLEAGRADSGEVVA